MALESGRPVAVSEIAQVCKRAIRNQINQSQVPKHFKSAILKTLKSRRTDHEWQWLRRTVEDQVARYQQIALEKRKK